MDHNSEPNKARIATPMMAIAIVGLSILGLVTVWAISAIDTRVYAAGARAHADSQQWQARYYGLLNSYEALQAQSVSVDQYNAAVDQANRYIANADAEIQRANDIISHLDSQLNLANAEIDKGNSALQQMASQLNYRNAELQHAHAYIEEQQAIQATQQMTTAGISIACMLLLSGFC